MGGSGGAAVRPRVFRRSFGHGPAPGPPSTDRVPAVMPDRSWLALPLRNHGDGGAGGLPANQASFAAARRAS